MRQVALMLATVSIWFVGPVLKGQEPIRTRPPAIAELGPAKLVVSGIDGTVTLTAAELYRMPQQTVKTTDHEAPVTFQGVLLTDLFSRVLTPTGENFHSTGASYYLVAEAEDGYRAVFAWAELDSSFMDKAIYVVTKRDGKPLSSKEGPFQLIVPGEKRNGRWVRQLTALSIRQAN